MDTQFPDDQDALRDVARRLAEWRPAPDGLDVDAMLFAAGLAAGRRCKVRMWPALCTVLILQVAGLAIWAMSERSGRLALGNRLHTDSSVVVPVPASDTIARTGYVPRPDDYFQQRRRLEKGTTIYVASLSPAPRGVVAANTPEPAQLRAGEWNELVDSLD